MSRSTLRQFVPFLLLLILILSVYILNFHHLFSFHWLEKEHLKILLFEDQHPFLSPFIFIAIYTLSVCLVIPDSIVLMLISGMIFPLPLAISYSLFSETVGALIIFSISRGLFYNHKPHFNQPLLRKFLYSFSQHSNSYLLFFRISHLFPYWLINVFTAYLKIDYWKFIWTTILGLLPLTIIVANAGRSLVKLFAQNRSVTLSEIFTTEMKLVFLFLGLISLVPIVLKWAFKKWKK